LRECVGLRLAPNPTYGTCKTEESIYSVNAVNRINQGTTRTVRFVPQPHPTALTAFG